MKRFYRLCFYSSASSSSSSSASSSSLPIPAYDRIQGVETLPNYRVFSYDELRVATNGFHPSNKSGEGGFGSVYEGRLQDGTQVAVKVLSAESVQGDREFMSEIASISYLKHTNLVKLHGCCIYGPCRILVYDLMQNNSLAQVLHGGEKNRAKLSWRLRTRIAEGIAKALSYIHEQTPPPISALELLEPYIVSGQTTIDFDVNRGEYFLVEKAWEMYKSEELIQLVDPMLNGSFYEKEAVRLMKVGLLCVQEKSGLRPHMSTVIKMMNGEINVDEIQVSRPGIITSIMDVKIGQSSSSSSRWPCSPCLYSRTISLFQPIEIFF